MNDRNDSDSVQNVAVSIGAVSRATGIAANTLRTWERRYGFPQPERSESGQRVYDPAVIGHLRLVARALERGHRPKHVLTLPRPQLVELLEQVAQAPRTPTQGQDVTDWISCTRRLDGAALDNTFRQDLARLGLLRFLSERSAAFLIAIGQAWSDGELEVFQEHWASERLRRFLMETWEPLSHDATGPHVVASTLPGDQHDLGLHMAVAVMAMCGWQIVFLGRDTPVEDIVAAASHQHARCALVSISPWLDPDAVQDHLADLAERVGDGVTVLAGGTGAPGWRSPRRGCSCATPGSPPAARR